MLEKELDYYLQNQSGLLRQYADRFLIIKDCEVKGHFGSSSEAYIWAASNFEVGSFQLQHCTPGASSHTKSFRTIITL